MPPRNSWNAYWRASESDRWTWLAEGSFFTEANGAALLRAPARGQVRVCFGRQLPHETEPRTRRIAQ
jgi:hypothetical protein